MSWKREMKLSWTLTLMGFMKSSPYCHRVEEQEAGVWGFSLSRQGRATLLLSLPKIKFM